MNAYAAPGKQQTRELSRLGVLIRAESDDSGRRPVWVNVYRVDRCYGGPEEGGWWYDVYECVESVRLPYLEALAFAGRKALEYHSDDCIQDPFRYIRRGWKYEVRVEEVRALSDTSHDPRPVYC